MSIWQRLIPGCPERLAAAAQRALEQVKPLWARADELVLINQAKVLRAFQAAGISDIHFAGSTGYAYGDIGRERIEQVFARVFGTEAALVRAQFASGTHAITCGLFGALRPGDRLIAAAGTPYDTMRSVIAGSPGSLVEWGVTYEEVALTGDGAVNVGEVARRATQPDVKVLFIQRSRGYSLRPTLSVERIGEIIRAVKGANPGIICIVDNCYGEFTQEIEPSDVGADLVCGSLIKNPGGGIAPTGGYVVGRQNLVDRAAARLFAPGIAGEVGANFGINRLILQGFFLAPHVTGEALKGAQFTAALFAGLGYNVRPRFDEVRYDLVQAVELGTPAGLVAFCEAVQKASPVDAHVRPEPWDMPGYTDQVIMAAGTFNMGSSIELSADGPMRPPYAAYFQGGLTREHVIWAALNAANELLARGHLRDDIS
ncbi:MAG TPA: methionine gamma-lyase family protein [Symbiobacteriaceae bacterium]|nr:methionine gamma-lyase family protein [Symbiobacteriaceae bacterium]